MDLPARLEDEAVAERRPDRVRHLDLAGKPVQFQPRGQIHRLPPDVVGKFVAADDPGHERAAGNPRPDLQIDAMGGGEPFHQIGQQQRHAGEPRQMIRLRPAYAGDRHVAIADGLDLLHPVRRRQPVERGDDLVEKSDGALNAEPLRELGEADEIGEEDGGVADIVGYLVARLRLEALGDRLWQDIGEQGVGLGARAVGHGEGVSHDQRDDREGGGGRGNVEVGEQGRIGGDLRALGREQKPRRHMQREPDRNHAETARRRRPMPTTAKATAAAMMKLIWMPES